MDDSMNVIYITRQQVIDTYIKTIGNGRGLVSEVVRTDELEEILQYVHDDKRCSTVEEKLSHLVYSLNLSHVFPDGNKRLSVAVGALFLLLNGYVSCMGRYMSEMENIANNIALGNIDLNLLKKMLHSIIMSETDYEESLKLEYLEAISEGGIGMEIETQNMTTTGKRKIVFISYCWEDDVHTAWVKHLAEDLAAYVKIRLDQKLPLGVELNRFMEQAVATSDKVLIIASPEYKERADNRRRGVGYETSLITDDLVNDQNSVKFIPIIRKGTKETAYPRYLGSRKGLDMTDDAAYEENLTELIRNLLEY